MKMPADEAKRTEEALRERKELAGIIEAGLQGYACMPGMTDEEWNKEDKKIKTSLATAILTAGYSRLQKMDEEKVFDILNSLDVQSLYEHDGIDDYAIDKSKLAKAIVSTFGKERKGVIKNDSVDKSSM
jgi:hypothetical protein